MNKNNKYSEVAVFWQRVEDRELVVLDCGKNSATFYDGNDEEKCAKITHEVLLEMASDPKYKGYAMVVEDAHFGVPRGPNISSPALQRKRA